MKPKVLDVQPYKGPEDLAERASREHAAAPPAGGTLDEQFIAALTPFAKRYAGNKAAQREIILLVLTFGVSSARKTGMSRAQLDDVIRQVWEGGRGSAALILQ